MLLRGRLLVLLWCLDAIGSSLAVELFGIQSGPDDHNSFAGGVVYDAAHQKVYMVGATYGSHFFESKESSEDYHETSECFLATLDFSGRDVVVWQDRMRHGRLDEHYVCTAAALGPGTDFLYPLAYSPNTGYAYSSILLEVLTLQHTEILSEIKFSAGGSATVAPVTYPVDLAVDDAHIYMASQFAFEVEPSPFAAGNQPDLTTSFPLGAVFGMGIHKTSKTGLGNTYEWGKSYQTQDFRTVRVANILHIPSRDILLVAGCTEGYGREFGKPNSSGTYNWDGFVTKFDAATGELLDPGADNEVVSVRVVSQADKDDYIEAMCMPPGDPGYFYLVGTTKGSFDGHDKEQGAFLIKMRVDDLSVEWEKMIQGKLLHGVACAAGDDGHVYLGGNVYIDGTVTDDETSAGGNDVYVARYTATGKQQWIHQFGSAEEDMISARGGLAIDEQGNVLVYGYTKGFIARPPEKGENKKERKVEGPRSDIFLLSLSKDDGSHLSIAEMTAAADDEDLTPGGKFGVVVLVFIVVGVVWFGARRWTRRRRPTNMTPNERMTEMPPMETSEFS